MQPDIAPNQTTATEDLVPELREYQRQFEAIKRDADDLLAGLTDAQFNWHPVPGRWSMAECLAHLNITGQVYLPVIDRGINGARSQQMFGQGPFRHGLLGKLFIRATEPPAKIKVKAPKLFAPLPEHLLAVVGPAFASLQEQLLRRVREANGIDLGRVRVTSPVSKLLKLSLGQCFAFIAAHERRHLWQARQVKNEHNFPGQS
jgi:hypothetical protein